MCTIRKQQGKSEGFDSCDRPGNFAHSNPWFFSPHDLEVIWMTSKNNRTPLLGYIKHCALFQNHQWIQTGVTVQKRSIQVKTGDFFYSVWPWNLTDDLEKQYGASSMLLQVLYIISYPSVHSKWSNSPASPNSGQNLWFFLFRMTFKFEGWPWKTIGYLF